MYKIYTRILGWPDRHARTIMLTMKLITIILFTTIMQVSASTFAQKLNFTQKNASLTQIFKEIKRQTGYTVFWPSNSLADKVLDADFRDLSIEKVLKKCLEGQRLDFVIERNTIVIREPEMLNSRSVLENVMDYFNQINIRGKVTNDEGKALPGATVVVKNTGKTTITDANGEYRLTNVDEDATIVFSFTGFKSREIKVRNTNVINVMLQTDVADLDDVVVVGYGTTKRKDLVGSVATITGDDIRKLPATNFTQGLVARSPGVQVSRPSGIPGAGASIRIRGLSTVMGVNDPLFVIDGIPVQLYNGEGGTNAIRNVPARGLMDPLAGIDANDIESVEVLKDATATAIYGSRAANGVIIVTTKKGKAGEKPVLSLSYNVTAEKQNKFYEVLSASEYIKFMQETYEKLGKKINDPLFPGTGNTDWQREISQTGLVQNLNLNLLGSSRDGGTIYGFSTGLTDQKGILINSGFKRYSVRSNVESKVLSFLKVGTNLMYTNSKVSGSTSPIFTNNTAAKYRPDLPVFNPDGTYADNGGTDNPVAARQFTRINESQRVLASGFAELELVQGLKVRSSLAFDINDNVTFGYSPSWLLSQQNLKQKGSRSDVNFKYVNRIFDNTLNFNRAFNKHRIDAVVGASWTLNQSNFSNISSINFPDDKVLNNLGSAGTITGYNSGGDNSGLESYFVRANYNYDGKYYLTLTGRADNSTKFGPQSQWGYFPSVGLAWRFSKEKFIADLGFVDDAKLRVTTGKTGTSAFGGFGFLTLFNTGYSYNGVNGLRANPEGGLPNPDIHWESTLQTDVALELSFLKSRLTTAVTYYKKYTKGLITGPGVSVSTGYTFQTRNIGDVSNRGVEINVTGTPVRTRDFNWVSDLNLTFNRNKVEKNYGTKLYGLLVMAEGLPLNGILGYRTNGLYQNKAEIDELNAQARIKTGVPTAYYQTVQTAPGDVRYVDVNGDGIITTADRVVLGYAQNPKYYGGWNNTFRYKNFELSALFQFDVGSKLQREYNTDTFFSWSQNVSREVLKAWTPENPNTKQPRNFIGGPPQNTETRTDRFIDDCSLVRLKNVQLSYLLHGSLLKKLHIQQISVFTSMTNIVTWTRYKGLDPEANSENSFTDHGRDTGVYPQSRGITFGANFKF